jgi:hypothetical protein
VVLVDEYVEGVLNSKTQVKRQQQKVVAEVSTYIDAPDHYQLTRSVHNSSALLRVTAHVVRATTLGLGTGCVLFVECQRH